MLVSKYRAAAGTVAIGYVLGFILRLFSNLVLTRLLLPEAFGVMLLLVSCLTVVTLFTDVGITPSLLRHSDPSEPSFRGTLWSLQIIQGVASACIVISFAVALHLLQATNGLAKESVYSTQGLPLMLGISALSCVITGFRSMKFALAQKFFQQGVLIRNELICQAFSICLICSLAWYTGSVWAFVVGMLATQSLAAILSHTCLPGPKDLIRWEARIIKHEWPFARWIWISSTVGVLAAQADKLLMSAILSSSTLGLYAVAVGLIGAVEAGLSKVIAAIGLPMLTELQRASNDMFKARFQRISTIVEYLSFVSIGMFITCGPALVKVLYPPAFQQSGYFLSLMAFSLASVRCTLSTQLYLAQDHSKFQAVYSVTKCCFGLVAISSCYYFFGLSGAIVGVSLQAILSLLLAVVLEQKLGIQFRPAVFLRWVLSFAIGASIGFGLSEVSYLLFRKT